ncbi:MAG: efflux transporter outer membrane subunit [Verrucomicrobiales bacterium]|nr:efflux transporter outer membrane subunit [Verrucomicrobiales bacterium]
MSGPIQPNQRECPGWRRRSAGAWASAVLWLGVLGCRVGPDYQPPEVRVPDAWHQAAAVDVSSPASSLVRWWTLFQDPTLEALINRASTGNLNLKIAAARIDEARALRGVARSGLLPQVNATGNAQVMRFSEATTPVPPGGDRQTGFYSVGAAASWELDVWGRVRRAMESADASLAASVEDYRDTLVILNAEIAATYVEVRTLQERIRYAEQNAAMQAETLQLTRNLNDAGLVGDLDVSQASLNLARTRSAIPSYRAGLDQSINRLGVLLGHSPDALHAELVEPAPIPTPPQGILAGVPANLLRQRPDIRRAERLLAAQTARVGVATADLYPQLSLPGTLTLEAFDPGNLDGSSLAYAFGPALRWNLFSGGRIRNTIRAEEARTAQSLHAYEQTVLLALEDTENSLVAVARERDRQVEVIQARDSARTSVGLVKDLYRSGLTHFQNVLDMERSLAVEEDNLAVSRGALAADAVAVYRALGGGWDPQSTPPPGAGTKAATTDVANP